MSNTDPNLAKKCPFCGSELYEDENGRYCSNPGCRYPSIRSPRRGLDPFFGLALRLLGLTLLVAGIAFLLLSFLGIPGFTFLFIPVIFPIPFLARYIRRRGEKSRKQYP